MLRTDSRPKHRAIMRFAAAGLVLLVCSGAATAQAQQAGEKIVVREAVPSKAAGFWPNYVAAAEGFYAKEGLDFKLFVMDPNITVSALIGNGVEIAYADSTQLLYALEKHADLVAFGLSSDRQPYRLMAGPSIKTVAQLKGKKIGITSDIDVYTYVIKEILRAGKLDPDKDVQWVIGGNQNRRLAAIISGAIDAGLFSPPSDARLRDQGFNGLAFTPDLFPNLALSTEAARRNWAQQHGDVLRRVLRAEAEAVRWLNDPANKARAMQIITTELGASPSDAEQAYQYYIGSHVWPDACIHEPGLVNVVKIMRITHQLKSITEADVPKFADKQWCSH